MRLDRWRSTNLLLAKKYQSNNTPAISKPICQMSDLEWLIFTKDTIRDDTAVTIPALPSNMSSKSIRRRKGWLTTFSDSLVVKPTPVNADLA